MTSLSDWRDATRTRLTLVHRETGQEWQDIFDRFGRGYVFKKGGKMVEDEYPAEIRC
jgi:hypothetical protein